jgi:Uma2 family endonuclease
MNTAMQSREHSLTFDQYLELDARCEETVYEDGVRQYEYDGERAYAMAGASPEHSQIAGNTATALNIHLRPRGCRVAQSDQRVALGPRKRVYPDVVVTCDQPEYIREPRPATLVNPQLIVEVLSESTSEQDRTWKLAGYCALASVKEIWFIEQTRPHVTRYYRADSWGLSFHHGLDGVLRSEHFDLEIPLSEIYTLVF